MPVSDQGAIPGRYQVIPRTLIFITRPGQVLLVKGSPNKRLWAGKYNGIGGHVEAGEDILTSARRELLEESGLSVEDLRLCGTVMIDTGDNPGIALFVFIGNYQGGNIIASSEGQLEWISIEKLDQLPLVEDLTYLLPEVLRAKEKGTFFSACYWYDGENRLQIKWG
ncbi:MAG: 8-oxo-dGTP diphosphatase [Anaerolineales bacterium]